MWRIYRTEISCAHHIEGHPKCGKTHGHNYTVIVKVRFSGWLDFHDLRQHVDEVLDLYDHKDLGNMTCESLAETIRSLVAHRLNLDVRDVAIEVWETESYGVTI